MIKISAGLFQLKLVKMNIKVSIFLTIFVILELSDKVKTQTARCDYVDNWYAIYGIRPSNVTYYACNLNTEQLDYGQELVNIQGQQEIGYNDDDVKYLVISSGHKLKKFSSIFCRKFSNLEVIYTNDADIELFDDNSLSNCNNLKKLDITSNKIQEISENFMIRNSKLNVLYIRSNQLTTLPENLLRNQKNIEDLWIYRSEIKFLPSNIFRPLVKIELLYLSDNKLQSIDPGWFVTLQTLKWVRLDGNQIVEIPSKSFASLRNLARLLLNNNKLKLLNSNSFDGLHNLQILDLQSNEISDLPVGVLTPLKNLQELNLRTNKLTTIHSDSFNIHNQLTKVWLQDNKINAIDSKVIDNTAVSTIYLTNNICSQFDTENRNKIKPNLKRCFDNYQPRKHLNQNSSQSSSLNQNQAASCGKRTIGHGNIIGGTQINSGDYPW